MAETWPRQHTHGEVYGGPDCQAHSRCDELVQGTTCISKLAKELVARLLLWRPDVTADVAEETDQPILHESIISEWVMTSNRRAYGSAGRGNLEDRFRYQGLNHATSLNGVVS
jgi:hypothetical protein